MDEFNEMKSTPDNEKSDDTVSKSGEVSAPDNVPETVVSSSEAEVDPKAELSGQADNIPEYAAQPQPNFDPQTGLPLNDSAIPFNQKYAPDPAGKINFSTIEQGTAEKIPNSGFKIFIIIACVVLAIAIALGGGYIIGSSGKKSSTAGLNSGFTSDELADRPTSTAEEGSASYVYNQTVNSIVLIDVYSYDDTSAGSQASGVVYTEDGYIVTNDHIYKDIPNPQFLVTFSDGSKKDAQFVAGDSRTDLAVLKVNANGLEVATFGDSSQAMVGEEIVAIGNPGGNSLSFSLTEGTISAVGRWAANNSNYSMQFIQIDAAINPGSSGGALCNMYGQVIGITAWKYVGTYYENVGFAIPTTTVKRVCDSLIANGYVTDRVKLGIKYQFVSAVTAKLNGYSHTGLYVAEITSGTPMASSGIAVGDTIIQINGQDISDASVVLQALDNCSPNQTVTLQVLSGTSGNTFSVDVQLVEDKGSSSYTTEKSATSSDSTSSSSGNGEFNFPNGD